MSCSLTPSLCLALSLSLSLCLAHSLFSMSCSLSLSLSVLLNHSDCRLRGVPRDAPPSLCRSLFLCLPSSMSLSLPSPPLSVSLDMSRSLAQALLTHSRSLTRALAMSCSLTLSLCLAHLLGPDCRLRGVPREAPSTPKEGQKEGEGDAQSFCRSPSRPLRPTVVNTVGLSARISGRYPIKPGRPAGCGGCRATHPPLSMSLSLFAFLSLFRSFSLSLSLTHTHTHSLSLSFTHSLTHSGRPAGCGGCRATLPPLQKRARGRMTKSWGLMRSGRGGGRGRGQRKGREARTPLRAVKP